VQSSPDTLVFWIFFFAKRNIRLLRAALVVFILDWKIIDVEFSSRAPLLHSIIKENIKKKNCELLVCWANGGMELHMPDTHDPCPVLLCVEYFNQLVAHGWTRLRARLIAAPTAGWEAQGDGGGPRQLSQWQRTEGLSAGLSGRGARRPPPSLSSSTQAPSRLPAD